MSTKVFNIREVRTLIQDIQRNVLPDSEADRMLVTALQASRRNMRRPLAERHDMISALRRAHVLAVLPDTKTRLGHLLARIEERPRKPHRK